MDTRNPPLRGRAGLTFLAHLFKALTRQHHTGLIPILRPLLPLDGVVFDVGAHAGQMSKLFARLVPGGRVYAFEPGAYALAILRPVVALKGRGRVSVETIAFGAAPGVLTLTTPIKRSGSLGFGLSHLGDGDEKEEGYRHEVKVETIDGFAERRGIVRLDLIKADIEGWELQMLRGAEKTLERFRPVVFLEAVDAYLGRAGDSRAELWRFLTDRGYVPRRVAPGLPSFEPEADGDVIWVPSEKLKI